MRINKIFKSKSKKDVEEYNTKNKNYDVHIYVPNSLFEFVNEIRATVEYNFPNVKLSRSKTINLALINLYNDLESMSDDEGLELLKELNDIYLGE